MTVYYLDDLPKLKKFFPFVETGTKDGDVHSNIGVHRGRRGGVDKTI